MLSGHLIITTSGLPRLSHRSNLIPEKQEETGSHGEGWQGSGAEVYLMRRTPRLSSLGFCADDWSVEMKGLGGDHAIEEVTRGAAESSSTQGDLRFDPQETIPYARNKQRKVAFPFLRSRAAFQDILWLQFYKLKLLRLGLHSPHRSPRLPPRNFTFARSSAQMRRCVSIRSFTGCYRP